MEKSSNRPPTLIRADPAVESVSSIGRGNMSVGSMLVSLKPLSVRKESVEQVIDRLRGKMAKITDANFLYSGPGCAVRRRRINRYQYA